MSIENSSTIMQTHRNITNGLGRYRFESYERLGSPNTVAYCVPDWSSSWDYALLIAGNNIALKSGLIISL